MAKTKALKLFNGRGYNCNGSLYIAANSRADASRMLAKIYKGSTVSWWQNELKSYFAECWGNSMDGIKPKRGVWASDGNNNTSQIQMIHDPNVDTQTEGWRDVIRNLNKDEKEPTFEPIDEKFERKNRRIYNNYYKKDKKEIAKIAVEIEKMQMLVEDKDRDKFNEVLNSLTDAIDPDDPDVDLTISESVKLLSLSKAKKLLGKLRELHYESNEPEATYTLTEEQIKKVAGVIAHKIERKGCKNGEQAIHDEISEALKQMIPFQIKKQATKE